MTCLKGENTGNINTRINYDSALFHSGIPITKINKPFHRYDS